MMAKTLKERFDPIPLSELTEEEKLAVQAAERSAKKLRERKRALGHKMVVWKDGKPQIVDP